MAKRRVARKTGDCELPLTEWHEVLSEIVDLTEESAVQRTMVHFLRTSKSGKACLEGAKRLRPDLEIGAGLELEEVLAAYDTMKLLAQLIASVSPLPASVPMSAVAIGIGFGAFVGLVFGFLPAYRASRLLPVDALSQGS